jgi:DNA polymerase-1
MPNPLLLLIDGHSLAFRAYYAFATSKKGALRTSTGIPTSVCFGFLNSLLQVVESQKPDSIAIAFDLREPTFRHQADPDYKANRQETPEEFLTDLNNLYQLLSALNLKIVTSVGYEADDILATLAQQSYSAGYRVKIVSGDRDLFQLVDESKNISVIYLDNSLFKGAVANGTTEYNSAAAVENKMGVSPSQIVDYKALCGDKSDNIPGVLGIGDKTAVKLLKKYGSLAEIYDNIDRIEGAVKQKLQAGEREAKHSQYLAQLVFDAPINISLEEFKVRGFDAEVLKPYLEKLELKTFVQKIDRLQEKLGGKSNNLEPESANLLSIPSEPSDNGQLSLFEIEKSRETSSLEIIEGKNNEDYPIDPQIIDTEEKLNNLVKLLKNYLNIDRPVAWDTETTSLEPMDAELVGIGCCWGTNRDNVAYIPIEHSNNEGLDRQKVINALRPILENTKYPKAFQNTKFDRLVLLHQGIKLAGVVFDTMLASYVINSEHSHNLTDLSLRYLSGIRAKSYKELNIPKGKTVADLDINTVANYCGLDAYATFGLVEKLQERLKQLPELSKLLLEVEQPLEAVLAAMENRGIRIDVNYLASLSQQLEQNLQTIQERVYAEVGERFNLDSPKQLSEILFEKLGLNKKKSRKTKTGYSTDHATLEKLESDSPIVAQILEYRTLAKLKSTYVDALPNLVRKDTSRVHTDFNQTGTTTGRLSSSNPNLQNIPIRTEFSRQIRQAFIPEDNWLLVSADYSQIELRILAHLSQEPVLIEAYRTGQDVHSVTAKLVFEKDTVTPDERRLGKIINFGTIYGMGAQRFARESGISESIGKQFIEKYRQRYARVFAYLENVKKEAIANGFVTTILGRRRYFDFVSDSLRQMRGSNPEEIEIDKLKFSYSDAQLLRAAANSPIQGSSADIIKIAMVKLHQILADYQAKLLLQVHDELVLEIPPEELEQLQPKIQQTMQNAVELSVPLVVDIHTGHNWMEAK